MLLIILQVNLNYIFKHNNLYILGNINNSMENEKQNKKLYQQKILVVRSLLRRGLTINAYDTLGEILKDMEIDSK